MADSVTLSGSGATPPANTVIATDETAIGHAQIVKLAISTDASSVIIPADAANGLDVDVTRVQGVVAVNDNSGSLTVDGSVTATAHGVAKGTTAAADATISSVDADHNAIDVFIRGGGGSGGTSLVDDAAFTVATSAFTPVGGTYKSVRDAVDDNDGGAFAMTQRRAVYAALETPAGDTAMDDTNDAVRVNIVAGGGTGGTAMTDDAAFTVGSTQVTPVAGTYRTVRDSVNDNDGGALAMTEKRALYVAHETPNGDSLADETNDALRATVVTVVTIQGETYTAKEWDLTDAGGARTDFALQTATGAQQLKIGYLLVTADNANSVDVGVRIGFGTATLAALSSSGAAGILLSHPGLAAGSGISTPIGVTMEGALDEDLRITCEDPVSGSLRVVAYYKVL